MDVVILAAGVGSRLGLPQPKALTPLATGETILGHQLDALDTRLDVDRVIVVVGYKKDLIMEAFPHVAYVYNPFFDQTNTSQSLLRGLSATADGGVLWLNGDVVFRAELLDLIKSRIEDDVTFVSVNTSAVGEEEVKYRLDDTGGLTALNKAIELGALGEAIGVNYVSSSDRSVLLECLQECEPDDYFERAIELMIGRRSARVEVVDVSHVACVEVDFLGDLEVANEIVSQNSL